MCVCVCVCVCVSVCVHGCVCIDVSMCVCVHVHVHVHILCVCVSVHVHVHILCVCVCAGDNPPHDLWNETWTSQTDATAYLVSYLAEKLPNRRIYPALGNHGGFTYT